MLSKKTLAVVIAASVSTCAAADATDSPFSGNVALTSDYMFRGVTQTDNQMALQGGFGWAHDSGVYANIWASNVDSEFFGGSTDPQLEVDVYAGYSGMADKLGYDLGVYSYNYPGADNSAVDDYQTFEGYFGLSYAVTDALTASGKLFYAPELNFIGVDESAWYFDLGAKYALMAKVAVTGHVGFNEGDAFEEAGRAFGVDSYIDYGVGVTTEYAGVNLGLNYVATDSDGEDLWGDLADDRVVFSVSKTL